MNACVHTYIKPQTSSTRSRGPGWRIHGSVEDTQLSTNKEHSLSSSLMKQKKKAKIALSFASENCYFHIYDVITWEKLYKWSANHYS
jgi:hypothetical protein